MSLLGGCHSLNKKNNPYFFHFKTVLFCKKKISSEILEITCFTLEGHESVIFEDCSAEAW